MDWINRVLLRKMGKYHDHNC